MVFGPAVFLFLGRKSKISHEQNGKEFQFYIRVLNFRLLGSIIKKKVPEGNRTWRIRKMFHIFVSVWYLGQLDCIRLVEISIYFNVRLYE